MLAVLALVVPIFALILVGWGARRFGALGPGATREINRFVVYLALPAVLFDIVAKARWSDIWQPSFVAAFGSACAIVFALTVLIRLRHGRSLADAAVDGLNAGYANTAFLGFPLTAAVLGSAGMTPTLIATIITVCVLFAIALVLIEIGVQPDRDPRRLTAKVTASLVRNPLLIAPVVGALFLAFGIDLPAPMDSFLRLLGGAASPCALVALGLFLADQRGGLRANIGAVAGLTTLKLVAQPVLTWLLAVYVFHLPVFLTHAAVLLAALPTGTGPFMIAEFYRREASVTSGVVLIATLVSLVTITFYLSLVQ